MADRLDKSKTILEDVSGVSGTKLDTDGGLARPVASGSGEPGFCGAANRAAYGMFQDDRVLSRAEKNVPLDWNLGDVILGLYEVLPTGNGGEAFHAGGFGKVYKVHHKTWDVDLAVKAPHAHVFQTEAQKQNFISECRAWMELGMHPNIATCYYVRELGGVPRIFAEYVEGGSLEEWIRSGRLYEGGRQEALERILDISIQFAWGLHFAHEHGMVHQDVKPQNVMMTQDGGAKVVDFGLARAGAALDAHRGDAQQSMLAATSGGYTPAYCSPEQMNGQPLTRRTDIWSWGLSVLEMFSGGVTWQSGVIADHILQSFLCQKGKPDTLPGMPEGVAQLLSRCFAENAGDRPHTMLEAAERLEVAYRETCGKMFPRRWLIGADESADVLNNRALSYLDLGDQKEAERLWARALKLDPHHVASVYNYGLLQWRTGRMPDDELVRRLQGTSSTHSDTWLDEYLLGLIHMERGDAQEAAKMLEQAAKQSGNDENVLSALRTARKGNASWGGMVRRGNRNAFDGVAYFNGHSEAVLSVAISPDCRRAVTGSKDNTIRLYDLHLVITTPDIPGPAEADLYYKTHLRTFLGHRGGVRALALSVDGRFMLSGCDGRGVSPDNTLKLWDVETGECLRTLTGHKSGVKSVAISADGRFALSGSRGWANPNADQTMRLWDLSSGECIRCFESLGRSINSVNFSADGRHALSGGSDGLLKYWDVASGACVRTFEGHGGAVNATCISADGLFALSGSADSTIRLWDVLTGKYIKTLTGHEGSVVAVSISTDGRLALSGGCDGTLRLWDLSSGRCKRTLTSYGKAINAAVWGSDNQTAVTAAESQRPYLWKFTDSDYVAPWYLSRPEESAEAVVRENEYRKHLERYEELYQAGRFSEALRQLKEAREIPGFERREQLRDAWAKLYCLPREGFAACWKVWSFRCGSAPVETARISSDGRFALTGCSDRGSSHSMTLWDLASRTCVRAFSGHHAQINAIDMSDDGRLLLSASSDHTARIWETSSGDCLWELTGHTAEVNTACFSPDGLLAASGSADGTIKLWDIATGRCLNTLKGHPGNILDMCISSDGCKLFSACNKNTIKIWDVYKGKCLKTLNGEKGVPYLLTTWENGYYFFSVSFGREGWPSEFRVWNIDDGTGAFSFSGHKGDVHSVAAIENFYALTAGDKGTLRLWDITSGWGGPVYTFPQSAVDLKTVSVSANGRYALIGDGDGMLHLWELEWKIAEREQADWDDSALPYLRKFLILHRPVKKNDPLERKGKPEWTEQDFEKLMRELALHGYGWLRREGVRAKLNKMKGRYR